MAPKTIATLLILLALGTTGANDASAQGSGPAGSGSSGSGFRGGDVRGGGGGTFQGRSSHRNGFDGRGFDGRGFHRRGFHGPGFVGFGIVDGYGYGYDGGSSDWYGISSGYDPCPLFRQRVKTPDGWSVRMIPVC